MRDLVILLNLDGRAARSTAMKLRAERIYCRVLPAGATMDEILASEARGVVLAGGSEGEAPAIPCLPELIGSGLPVLAMGDAALSLCEALGGSLGERGEEAGVRQVRYVRGDALLRGVEDGERYFTFFRCVAPPASAQPLALTDEGILGFSAGDAPVYGMAFQAEPNDPDGLQLLINFCQAVCGCTMWWSNQAFIEHAVAEIDRLSDGGEALCAISGGVDSGVCAMLGSLALGKRLHCLFIDTGLLRRDESAEVMAFFRDQVGLDVKCVNAAEEFLSALAGVSDPAEKERIIFAHLRAIQRREVSQLPQVRLLLQGTNYSDTLDTEPPVQLENGRIRIAEPVRDLFKEEIRQVGEQLNMPLSVCRRQPFPGSGLALRIISDVTSEKLRVLREADAIFRQEIEAAGQNRRLFQYYASLVDNPVIGDEGCIITLRAVQAADGGTALAARLPVDLMERTTERILAQVPGVRRVFYDLTPSRSYGRTGLQ